MQWKQTVAKSKVSQGFLLFLLKKKKSGTAFPLRGQAGFQVLEVLKSPKAKHNLENFPNSLPNIKPEQNRNL